MHVGCRCLVVISVGRDHRGCHSQQTVMIVEWHWRYEWWNLATIYFPITLISLWDETFSSHIKHVAQFCHILDHTMLTVSVISLTCMHMMTKTHSDVYLSCLTQYLQDLQALHLHVTFVPTYHMALYLPHFFHLFGPVHFWWCFLFEHLVRQIQWLLRNHKVGKYTFG